MRQRREGGFTIVELLTVTSLTLLLLGLGATAIRHYWFVQSLEGAQSSLVSELRGQQQKARTKSYPYVQGVWFVPTSSRWGTVEYNVKTQACVKTAERKLEAGVVVSAASFTALSPQTASCRTAAGDVNAQIVFFNPAGTATQGTVTLASSRTGSAPKTLTVSALTGRVTE